MLTIQTLTKKTLETIIQEHFSNFGYINCSHLLESLKFIGFYYATCSGLSIALEDLKTPEDKDIVLNNLEDLLENVSCEWSEGLVTDTERFQQVLASWTDATEFLKHRIIEYYKKFEPTNSLYIMAFSGARGNISQVRQVIGMRGLMSDQSGKVISLPIQANFREGLSSIDYIVSSYGARKGIVDTALKTADAGYLTRRLVYVARDMVIRNLDCKTKSGILTQLNNETNLDDLIGKTLISCISLPDLNWDYSLEGETITEAFCNYLLKRYQKKTNIETNNLKDLAFFIKIRTILTCSNICQQCYGWDLAKRGKIQLGDAIGIIAAQSIGEPGTQLTMRTFHTGGVFTSKLLEKIVTPFAGKLMFPNFILGTYVRSLDGKKGLRLEKPQNFPITDWKGNTKFISLEKDSFLYISSSGFLKKNHAIGEFPKSTILLPIKKRKSIQSFLGGEIKIQKKNLFWVFSGKIFDFFQIPYCTYPKNLSSKKSFGKFFFSLPFQGIIKNILKDSLIIYYPLSNEKKELESFKSKATKSIMDYFMSSSFSNILNYKKELNIFKNFPFNLDENENFFNDIFYNINNFKDDYERNIDLNNTLYNFNIFNENINNKILATKTKTETNNISKNEISDSSINRLYFFFKFSDKKNYSLQSKILNNLELKQYFEIDFDSIFSNDSQNKLFMSILLNYYLELSYLYKRLKIEEFSRVLIFTLFFKLCYSLPQQDKYDLKKSEISFDYILQKKNYLIRNFFFSKNYQYIDKYSILGTSNFFSKDNFAISGYKLTKTENGKIVYYYLTTEDIWTLFPDQFSEKILFTQKLNEEILLRGQLLNSTLQALQSGRVLQKDGFRFLFQKALAIFLPFNTPIAYKNNGFIEKDSTVATLFIYSQKASDIVQGLPRIERIFENRKRKQANFENPSIYSGTGIILKNYSFRYYKSYFLNYPLDDFRFFWYLLGYEEIHELYNSLNFLKDKKKSNLLSTAKVKRHYFNVDIQRNYDKQNIFVPTLFERFFSIDCLYKSKNQNKLKKKNFQFLPYRGISVVDMIKMQITSNGLITNEYDLKEREQKLKEEKLSKKEIEKILKKQSEFSFGKKFVKACLQKEITFLPSTISFINFENIIKIKKVVKINFYEEALDLSDDLEDLEDDFKDIEKNGRDYHILEILDSNRNLIYLFPKKAQALSNSIYNFNSTNSLSLNTRTLPNKIKNFEESIYSIGVNLYSVYGNIIGAFKLCKKLQLMLLNTIQGIYKSQGVKIANIHLELILKKMFKYCMVFKNDNKNLQFDKMPFLLPYIKHDFNTLQKLSRSLEKQRQKPLLYFPTMYSITKVGTCNGDFLSRAAFQETKRMLQEAALNGTLSWSRSLKDSIIIGRKIPSGSAFTLKSRGLDLILHPQFKKNKNILVKQDLNIIENSNVTISKNQDFNFSFNKIFSFLREEISLEQLNLLYDKDTLDKFTEKRLQMIQFLENTTESLSKYSSKSLSSLDNI
jgi:hypothetical protein